MKIDYKFKLIFITWFLFTPFAALALPLNQIPHGLMDQTSAVIQQFGGVKFQLQLASLILFLIGTLKISFLRPLWDCLGKYKALAAPGLSLVAGILMLPSLSFQGIFAYLMSGAGAIVLHELLDTIKKIPGINKAWLAWVDLISALLYRKEMENKEPVKQDTNEQKQGLISVLGPFFGAITQGLILVNQAKSTEYQRKFTETQLAITAEERKGDDADDAKIEALYSELSILAQAAENEFKLALASRNGAAT